MLFQTHLTTGNPNREQNSLGGQCSRTLTLVVGENVAEGCGAGVNAGTAVMMPVIIKNSRHGQLPHNFPKTVLYIDLLAATGSAVQQLNGNRLHLIGLINVPTSIVGCAKKNKLNNK